MAIEMRCVVAVIAFMAKIYGIFPIGMRRRYGSPLASFSRNLGSLCQTQMTRQSISKVPTTHFHGLWSGNVAARVQLLARANSAGQRSDYTEEVRRAARNKSHASMVTRRVHARAAPCKPNHCMHSHKMPRNGISSSA